MSIYLPAAVSPEYSLSNISMLSVLSYLLYLFYFSNPSMYVFVLISLVYLRLTYDDLCMCTVYVCAGFCLSVSLSLSLSLTGRGCLPRPCLSDCLSSYCSIDQSIHEHLSIYLSSTKTFRYLSVNLSSV